MWGVWGIDMLAYFRLLTNFIAGWLALPWPGPGLDGRTDRRARDGKC